MDRDIAELAKEVGAKEVALGAGFHERIQRDFWFGGGDGEIVFEHRAEAIFLAICVVTNHIRNDRAEEKPPEFEGAIELFEGKRLDAVVEVAEMLGSAANGGKRFGSGSAEFGIFENADAQAAEILRRN